MWAMFCGCLELIDSQGVGAGVGAGVGVEVPASTGEALGLGAGANVVLGTRSVAGPEPQRACMAVNFTPV